MRLASRLEIVFVLVLLVLAFTAPTMGNHFLAPIERFAARFANRKRLSIFLVGFTPLLRIGTLNAGPL